MKAITIWQPWASAFPLRFKHFETRGWATNYRGPIAIHAAAKIMTIDEVEDFNCMLPTKEMPFFIDRFKEDGKTVMSLYVPGEDRFKAGKLPLGEVVAIAELTDCIEMTKEFISSLSPMERALGWYEVGRYAWKLENVRPIKSVKAKGQQGLWNWNGEYEVI